MSQSTLAVLAHPEFPQIYAAAIDEAIACVDRVLSRYKTPTQLCEYESAESAPGACDSLPCFADATVFHLADEREYCLKHHLHRALQNSLETLEVSRG